MVNIKIKLIIFFAAEDGEALYSQKNKDLELTVAQIQSSLLPNWGLKLRMSHKYNGSLRHYHKLLYTNKMYNLEETDELLEMYNLPRLTDHGGEF